MLLKTLYCFGFLWLSCLYTQAQETILKPLADKGNLLWQDEFNGNGLPDSTKWGYEEGFVRNKEEQFYTQARVENCREENGNLIIESKKEHFHDAGYTSASINTLGKYSFEGDIRIEVRAKLPQGKGIWPAIWMMGTNMIKAGWPRCSEIDIMEFVGHTPGTVFRTLHWWDSTSTQANNHMSKGNKLLMDSLHTNYHVFGMERKGNQLQFSIDDKAYLNFTVPPKAYPGSFTAPLYLLINTAIGGTWGGEVDDRIFPQKFYVDYVRVFRLE